MTKLCSQKYATVGYKRTSVTDSGIPRFISQRVVDTNHKFSGSVSVNCYMTEMRIKRTAMTHGNCQRKAFSGHRKLVDRHCLSIYSSVQDIYTIAGDEPASQNQKIS